MNSTDFFSQLETNLRKVTLSIYKKAQSITSIETARLSRTSSPYFAEDSGYRAEERPKPKSVKMTKKVCVH
jgi:hypothetical protein